MSRNVVSLSLCGREQHAVSCSKAVCFFLEIVIGHRKLARSRKDKGTKFLAPVPFSGLCPKWRV